MNKSIRGFTLIELMIALAILGVLAAITIPMYQEYRVRESRNEVKAMLVQLSQRLAEYKLVNNNYNTTLARINGSSVYPSSGKKLYNLTLVANDNSWTLFAFPAGRQVGDGSLSLTDQGWRCWVKGQDSACSASATTTWDGK